MSSLSVLFFYFPPLSLLFLPLPCSIRLSPSSFPPPLCQHSPLTHTHTRTHTHTHTHTQQSPPAHSDLYMLDYVANWTKMIQWGRYLIWPTAVPHFFAFTTEQWRAKGGQRRRNLFIYNHQYSCPAPSSISTVRRGGVQGHKPTRAERLADQTQHLTRLWFQRDVLLTNTSLITQPSLTGPRCVCVCVCVRGEWLFI